MHKTVIMMVGPSGCGKSTLERGLCQDRDNFHKVVSTTTRPEREGEVHGVDYYFITEQLHHAMVNNGDFIQTTDFGGQFYGSMRTEYCTPHPYATLVLVPNSIQQIIDGVVPLYRPEDLDLKIIHFDISDERLAANMRARGDTDEMIEQRIEADNIKQQWVDSGHKADLTITDCTLNEYTLPSVQTWLMFDRIGE